MSVLNKFINSSVFLTATSVYDDINLTTLAADGYYQFNGEYRQQLSGILGPLILCEECTAPPIPCGSGVNPPSGGQGLYNLDFVAGESAADVGAVLIHFNPASVPDGIRVLYDGVYYNALSSPTDGRIQSTSGIANSFTLVGVDNNCVPTLPNTREYNYFDGFSNNTWNPGTPSPQNITLNVGDDQYGGSSEYNTLVIPKPNALPSNIKVEVLGPCGSTAWAIIVECPDALPSFTSSSNQSTSTDCATADQTHYFANNYNATNTIPVVNNWVFSDSNGTNVLSNGNYVMSDNNVITVTSGVIDSIVACTSAPTYNSFYLTTSSYLDANDACNINSTVLLYHNGSSILPIVGDTIFQNNSGSTTATWSNYKGMFKTSNGSSTKSLTVNGSGVVQIVNDCASTETFYISQMRSDCSDFCDGSNNYAISLSKDSSDSYSAVAPGTTISGPTLIDGYYAYAETSTDTASGTFRLMNLVSNEVVDVSQCSGSTCSPL